MTIGSAEPVPPLDDNPFPPNAAAEVLGGDEAVTVTTNAVDRALRHWRAYRDGAGGQGRVIALLGEQGTGKTHIASRILHEVRELPGGDAQEIYVQAQWGGFRNTYTGAFLNWFRPPDILRRLREYYANIIADSLGASGFPERATQRLRDGMVDPQRFVTEFGLPESDYLELLNADLADVTRNKEFGAAFTLLLRGDLKSQVAEWLRGEDPDHLLQERGITTRIGTAGEALDAMGVLTLLYHGRARRFVLVLDEMDRVLPSASPPDEETLEAFRKFLKLMVEKGVFLVLAGLPELITAMGPVLKERLSEEIRVGQFTSIEARELVELSMARTHYGHGLGPFSDEIVDYIVELTGGNARQVIQLCHSCYQQSRETREVTETMVDLAAKGKVTLIEPAQLHQIVQDRLRRLGRTEFDTGHPIGGPNGPRADIWIPAYGSGVALMLSGALVKAGPAGALAERARQIKAADPRCLTLLIVAGYVSRPAFEALAGSFSEGPLGYTDDRFAEDFAHALSRLEQRMEVGDVDALRVVRTGLSQLTIAQATTQNFLENLASEVRSLQVTSGQQLATVQRELQEGPALPERVEEVFRRVLTELRDLFYLGAALGEAFGGEPGAAATLLQRMTVDADKARAIGVAYLAEQVIVSFREAVLAWFGEPPGQDPAVRDDRLKALCRNCDTALEYLPLNALNALSGPASWSVGHSDVLDEALLPRRRGDLYGLLDDLGAHVMEAVRAVLSEGG
ncbi:MAG: hypothetical protein ABIS86_09755 [Streptosporangiaceae bacterium]